jgi:aryl-alcohol dehydrogenase-like predicted oxidoreductase
MQRKSEQLLGQALMRHPEKQLYTATKIRRKISSGRQTRVHAG